MKLPLLPLLFITLLGHLHAAERVALVIGNDAYQNTFKLDNCVNDARAVTGVLREAEFTVIPVENATAEQMHEKVAEFKQLAAGCKVGLFYYAGHGMEDEGKNYLIPVDAALERKAQVALQTISLAHVTEQMKEAKIPAKILLLDCCRNMPLGRGWRGSRGGGGLAGIDATQLPESTLIYFATAPGTEALDAGASGKHSPFTEGLLQKLKTPGIHAFEALMQVEDVVHQQTDGRQRPKLFSDGETAAFRQITFCNIPSDPPSPAPPAAAQPTTSVSPATATKESPFVNSLGMKFVPIGIKTGGKNVLLSVWETRRKDYEAYANAKSRVDDKWKSPGFSQTGEHPVTCVSCDDAVAFCDWLTEKERASGSIGANDRYRQPTDAEWSHAVGIGEKEDSSETPEKKNGKIDDVFPWGTDWPPTTGAGNFDSHSPHKIQHDGYHWTSPVGSFDANQLGIYDLGGNVWEWCLSYYDGKSGPYVLRGGSWLCNDRHALLSSRRETFFCPSVILFHNYGFRCALVSSTQ